MPVAHEDVAAEASVGISGHQVAGGIDERDEAVKRSIAAVIATAKQAGRKIGICGQAPSDYPDFAQFLVEQGINSISLNPDAVLKTTVSILEMEEKLRRRTEPKHRSRMSEGELNAT